jgi:peptidoglycan/LPS O-acetylase OafA/YrhL
MDSFQLANADNSVAAVAKKQNHIPFLDGVRGFAVLAVFLYHSLGAAYGWDKLFVWHGLFKDFAQPASLLSLFPLTYGGTMGVATFFVVSGFCIHLSYVNSRHQGWAAFFWRRFFRIYPAYVFCLAFFFFLWPWYHYSLESPSARISLLSHIFAFHNYVYDSKFAINPSFWSIAAEIQLYIVYPLLVLLTIRFGWRRSLIALLVLEVVIRLLDVYFPGKSFPHYWISNSPLAFMFSWTLGAYLAECWLKGRKQVLAFIPIPLVAVLAVILPLFRPTATLDFPLFALLAALIIDRLLSRPLQLQSPVGRGLRYKAWQHLSFLGVVSYSFYLIHQPLVDALKSVALWSGAYQKYGALPLFYSNLMLYPLIFFFSWALYRLVEKPFVSLGRALWRAKPKPASRRSPG